MKLFESPTWNSGLALLLANQKPSVVSLTLDLPVAMYPFAWFPSISILFELLEPTRILPEAPSSFIACPPSEVVPTDILACAELMSMLLADNSKLLDSIDILPLEPLIKFPSETLPSKNVGGRPTKKQKLKNVKMPEKLDFKSIFGDNATGGSHS